jgi:hypothetical protein
VLAQTRQYGFVELGRFESTDGYLRQYDNDLGGALDLQTAGLTGAEADGRVWRAAELALQFGYAELPGEIALAIAEPLQEHVMMNVTSAWPRCPEHPQHPLWLVPGDTADTCWTCTASGKNFAQLGGLASLREAP